MTNKMIILECINKSFGTDFEDPNVAEVFFTIWAEIQETIYVSKINDNRPPHESKQTAR